MLTVYRGAKKNAARKGRPFKLTPAELKALYENRAGVCAISGQAFSLEKYGSNRAPFAPSLDRIDCSKGYVKGNVRLVSQIVNLAMNTWGEEPIRILLGGLTATPARTESAPAPTAPPS